VSLKSAAARLIGLTATDVYFVKSMRHSWWLRQFYRLPLQRLDVPQLTPVDTEDEELTRRIIVFYKRATRAKAGSLGDRSAMWDRNLANSQGPLVQNATAMLLLPRGIV